MRARASLFVLERVIVGKVGWRGEQSTGRRVHCPVSAWAFLRNVFSPDMDNRRATRLITR